MKSRHKFPENSSRSYFSLSSLSSQSKLLLSILISQSLILVLGAGGTFLLHSAEPLPIQLREQQKSHFSLERVVESYFWAINDGIRQRDLEPAWQLMSAKFQIEDAGGDYLKFKTWWQKLQRVEIQQITESDLDTPVPLIEARLLYHLKDGRICPDRVRFTLVWDVEDNLWLLDSRDRLLPNGKFVCPPA